jgi:hypothetical protein
MTYRLQLALAMSIASVFSSPSGAADQYKDIQPLNLDSWHKVTTGVYDKTRSDGSVIRLSFGAAGADYDRAWLNQNAADALSAAYATTDTAEATALLDKADSYAKAAMNVPAQSNASVVPLAAQSGSLCGGAYNYTFGSNFGAGGTGAISVARARVWPELFVLPPPPTSSSVYNSATVTPYGSSPITNTSSGSYATVVPDAVVDWQIAGSGFPIGTGDCTGATFSSISLSGGACKSTPAYVSLSESYPSCQ